MSEREDWNRRLQQARSLKVTGVMLALLCGLCTATCAGPTALGVLRGEVDVSETSYLGIAGVIGGLPIFCGLILYLGGIWVERGLRAERLSKSSKGDASVP